MSGQKPVVEIAQEPTSEALSAVARQIEADGVAIVEPWDSSVEAVMTVGGLLGTVQSHIRSNDLGIAEAVAEKVFDQPQEWHQHKSEYQAYGTGETPPHADGTYLNGIIQDGAGVTSIGPPKYVVLQVVRNADAGGKNFVVDGRAILLDLLDRDPELLTTLLAPGCITFCRDDQVALQQSVFRWFGDGRLKFRFRSDSKGYAPEWSLKAVEYVRDHYSVDPEFRKIVDVKDGQVLIVDNSRMMHGRTRFANAAAQTGRLLRRIWIQDVENSDYYFNVQHEVPSSRALDAYVPYGPRPNNYQGDLRIEARTGIHVADDVATRVEELVMAASTLPSRRDS